MSTTLIEASKGNLSPTTIFSFNPTYGILAIAFEMEINRIKDDIETTILENIHTWDEILNWKKSSTCLHFENADLFLQYIDEKNKYNNTTPTSIRILDKELARNIFGFYPKYINYDFFQGDKKFTPRYYAPYISK